MMILADNTVLSNLALIHHPEFINQAFIENVGTTEDVFRELQKGEKLGQLPDCDWTWLERLPLSDEEHAWFYQFAQRLGEGEASCLAVAVHRGYKIATDDKDVRLWAMRLTIPYTGTLGVLATLVKQGQMSLEQGNRWLRNLIEIGYQLDDLVAI